MKNTVFAQNISQIYQLNKILYIFSQIPTPFCSFLTSVSDEFEENPIAIEGIHENRIRFVVLPPKFHNLI